MIGNMVKYNTYQVQPTLAITDGKNLAPAVRYSNNSSMIESGASLQ